VFLGRVVRALRANGIRVDTLSNTVARDDGVHVAGDLGAGSWGAGKDFSVWDGPDVAGIARENLWLQHRWLAVIDRERTAGRLGYRRPDLDQLLLTLWNALSSDWAFLVSRGQSVDYALRRAEEHRADFHRLAQLVEDGDPGTALAEAARQARHDRTFPARDARVTPGR
jgi:1,4-alpha-glucan branching enzyme